MVDEREEPDTKDDMKLGSEKTGPEKGEEKAGDAHKHHPLRWIAARRSRVVVACALLAALVGAAAFALVTGPESLGSERLRMGGVTISYPAGATLNEPVGVTELDSWQYASDDVVMVQVERMLVDDDDDFMTVATEAVEGSSPYTVLSATYHESHYAEFDLDGGGGCRGKAFVVRDSNCLGMAFVMAKDNSIKAQRTVQAIADSFAPEEGYCTATVQVWADDEEVDTLNLLERCPAGTAELPDVEKDGYKVVSWTVSDPNCAALYSMELGHWYLVNVTDDCTVTAQYAPTWQVLFTDENGRPLKLETVVDGESARSPTLERDGQVCTWSQDFSVVHSDMTVSAVW